MVCNMHSLPNEVLVHIFSCLDGCDVLRVSAVCKQWLDIVDCCSRLLKGIHISVGLWNSQETLEVFSTMSRKFSHFRFKNTVIDCRWFLFLSKYSSQFHHLSFECCVLEDISPPRKTLDNCINLKILEITDCNSWVLFSYLPNLKSLHITQERGFSDLHFLELQNIVSYGLQEFSLQTRVISDAKVYKRYYPEGTIIQNNPTDVLLSFPVIEDFIKRRSKTLVSLDLRKTDISDTAAMLLSEIDNLHLKRISLANCMRCSRIPPSFWNNQRCLVAIDLSCVIPLTDAKVVQLCASLPHLEDINLHHCTAINESVEKLFQLKHLRTLLLACCRGIKRPSFQKAISGFQSLKLRQLNLCGTNIDEDLIAQLLPLVTNLLELNLGRCAAVSDKNVSTISKTLKSLTYLNLSYCPKISDAGVTGRLSTQSCPVNPVPLSNIKGLLELNISHCPQLSSGSLTEAIRFQNLQSLDVTGCVHKNSATIAKLLKQNPRLKHCKH